MEAPDREAVATAVANTKIRGVRKEESVHVPLQNLKEYGVAILVDDQSRPIDILTSCDLSRVLKRAQGVTKETPAAQIFETSGRIVHTVRGNVDLLAVANKVAVLKLGTGIVMVDDDGRYAGYIFNRDLRQKAEEIASKARAHARDVKSRFPDAWSNIE